MVARLQVYRALNVLGNLGWCINNPVLDVAEAAWAHGGDFAGLPSRIVQLDVPPPALPYRFRTAASPQPHRQRQANQLTAQVCLTMVIDQLHALTELPVRLHILHRSADNCRR
jgi:DNA-directed RNA polymerase